MQPLQIARDEIALDRTALQIGEPVRAVAQDSKDAVEFVKLGRAVPGTEIRIVDGATLDIPGLSGQVADIIVQARTRISGQFSWRPEFRAQTTDPLLSRGDISVTGSRGPRNPAAVAWYISGST